jgi:hypothetical protein
MVFIAVYIAADKTYTSQISERDVFLELPELIVSEEEKQIFSLFRRDIDFITAMNVEGYYVILTGRAKNIAESFLSPGSKIDECTMFNTEINLTYSYKSKIIKLHNTFDGRISKTVMIYNQDGGLLNTYVNESGTSFLKY